MAYISYLKMKDFASHVGISKSFIMTQPQLLVGNGEDKCITVALRYSHCGKQWQLKVRNPYTRNILILLMTTRLSVKNASPQNYTKHSLCTATSPLFEGSACQGLHFQIHRCHRFSSTSCFKAGGDAEVSEMVVKAYLAT